jgi:RHS repeat-associated protein
VQEQSPVGTVTANLHIGFGTDERFDRYSGVGSFYLTDLLGSTVALSDINGTAVQTTYGYDPYGATSTSGAANTNPYQFTGRQNDGTGLYYYRARYYNPTWGRFINEDPAGLSGGVNLYGYADFAPTMYSDPYGLFSWRCITWGLAVGAIYSFGAAPFAFDMAAVGTLTLGSRVAIASSEGGATAAATVVRVIQKGEKVREIENEIKALTFTTGNEHAVVTLTGGQRAIVSGGEGGIEFAPGQISRIFGHTHPTSAGPSAADFSATSALGQTKQYVYHGGERTVVRP